MCKCQNHSDDENSLGYASDIDPSIWHLETAWKLTFSGSRVSDVHWHQLSLPKFEVRLQTLMWSSSLILAECCSGIKWRASTPGQTTWWRQTGKLWRPSSSSTVSRTTLRTAKQSCLWERRGLSSHWSRRETTSSPSWWLSCKRWGMQVSPCFTAGLMFNFKDPLMW